MFQLLMGARSSMSDALIRIKRGTRSQIDSAASSNGLAAGEPYLITDEGRLAVGTGVDSYAAMLKEGDSLPSPAVVFPFYKADGNSDPINLTSDNKLPFFNSTGTASNIPLVI